MKIISVVGARPNFMKIAPIISAIKNHNEKTGIISSGSNNNGSSESIRHILVHTGQHYDKIMSDSFFNDLNLPKPDISLGVGSASHAIQTAEIMKRFERVLLKEKPDIVIVVGDVNSTLACALVTSKISFDSSGRRPLIAHVEAGLRSFDQSMPEEINRILTDQVSDLLFVTEESGIENLKKENIPGEKIFFVGNTMIDTLLKFKDKTETSKILNKLGFTDSKSHSNGDDDHHTVNPFGLLTLHRPSNVDNKYNLLNIIKALKEISCKLPVIFPVHPRTQRRIREFGFMNYFKEHDPMLSNFENKIILIEPVGYLDFMCLMKNAKVVFTDSGGIQEETTCLGIPCITIRENTERPVTITHGTNILAGLDKKRIVNAYHLQSQRAAEKVIPKNWDGNASERILNIIVDALSADTQKKLNTNEYIRGSVIREQLIKRGTS